MTPAERRRSLARLQDLAAMIRDREMAALRAATLAREASEARLANLARPLPCPGLYPVAAALAEIRWQKWADQRRAEINMQLSRQIVDCNQARAKACDAFARAEVLGKLQRGPDHAS